MFNIRRVHHKPSMNSLASSPSEISLPPFPADSTDDVAKLGWMKNFFPSHSHSGRRWVFTFYFPFLSIRLVYNTEHAVLEAA
ncbi:hypothetical protein K435DRAFT_74045 [Dendrothele bispora CBS 962.96]|uniref:Uncharacterized protein n=1 Tax=Dendrothele bispora (strain CBS 962.96) TaxID=1314807 RepID=A0A4S8M4B5_DENBC|nr:hypothetical protein K435DRAFT_74045 [Dendrothele bispora CBS 962.96]